MDPENLKKIMSKAGKSSAGPAGKAIGAMAGVTAFGFGVYQSLFTVTNGQRAIIFNRFGADRGSTAFPEKGVNRRMVYEEGTHIAIPWFQRPIIYNIKTRPFTVTSRTGSMDLQMVDITIRVLTKPKLTVDPIAIKIQETEFTKNIEEAEYEKEQLQRQVSKPGLGVEQTQDLQGKLVDAETELARRLKVKELEKYDPLMPLLPRVYDELGTDKEMENRVLPSIVPEILKEVVARHNATALINNRNQVSVEVSDKLKYVAAKFHLEVEDVSLTNISFGPEYSKAVERKQVAIQEAERARFVVDQARQEAKSIVIAAEGEAASAELLNKAMEGNPAYLELRRIEVAKDVSDVISKSANRVYVSSDNLLMGLGAEASNKLFGAGK